MAKVHEFHLFKMGHGAGRGAIRIELDPAALRIIQGYGETESDAVRRLMQDALFRTPLGINLQREFERPDPPEAAKITEITEGDAIGHA